MILAGIDEAGYGPRLGPLVVAANAFYAPGPVPQGRWPECRFLRKAGPVSVRDSKEAYSAARGLAPLERVVHGFASQVEQCPADLGAFLARWSVEGTSEAFARPWYDAVGRAFPLAAGADELAEARRAVAEALDVAGLVYLGAYLCIVDEARYNEIVERLGNKAVLLFGRASILLRVLWERFGSDGVFVTVDRHGGRKYYSELLDIAFDEARIRVLEETVEESAYSLESGDRRMFVRFKVRAEHSDSPTALSSMWAKYAREALMCLFNDYWLSKAGGLARTAGYWVDGERFTADLVAAGVVSPAQVRMITRCR